jgi:hypothetical protein
MYMDGSSIALALLTGIYRTVMTWNCIVTGHSGSFETRSAVFCRKRISNEHYLCESSAVLLVPNPSSVL